MGRIIAADDLLSISANSTSDELIPSDKISCPERGRLVLLGMASATGVTCRFIVDGESLIDDEEVMLGDGTSGQLDYPDHLMVATKVRSGHTISLKFSNTTGGSLDVTFQLMIVD